MSNWTHACCNLCWLAREGERIPHRLRETEEETCCFCGHATTSGIFIREDPAAVLHCAGHDQGTP